MCWTSVNKPNLRIAEEDIHVKKVVLKLHGQIMSPVMKEFIWEHNKVYTTELGKPEVAFHSYHKINYFKIEKGFHSSHNIGTLEYEGKTVWTSDSLNCFKSLFDKSKGEKVVDAIIPKGSEYYVNDSYEYVSNQLILL